MKKNKYLILSSLYIAQGLPFGFFTLALPVLLREMGVGLDIIGLSSLLVLPWALKILWAPVIEGSLSRRHWVILANVGTVTSLLLMVFLPVGVGGEAALYMAFAGFFVINIFSATQDIATDAYAVIEIPAAQRGFANGIQVAGYRVGMILSGGLLLSFFTDIGWGYSLALLALVLMLFTLPAWAMDNNSYQACVEAKPLGGSSSLSAFFIVSNFLQRKGNGWWLAVLLVYKIADHLAGTMFRPLLVDKGFSLDDIAVVLGGVGFIAGLAGALCGGYIASIYSRVKALALFAVLQSVAIFSMAGIAERNIGLNTIYIVTIFEHLASGMGTACLFTLMMDRCAVGKAGSEYAFQSCVIVCMSGFSAAVSGLSVNYFGYQSHFLVAGFWSLLSVAIVSLGVIKNEEVSNARA